MCVESINKVHTLISVSGCMLLRKNVDHLINPGAGSF